MNEGIKECLKCIFGINLVLRGIICKGIDMCWIDHEIRFINVYNLFDEWYRLIK